MRVAKTKQTRRKRESRLSKRRTRRSTPPFSPLLAMMGGVKTDFSEYMDLNKLNKVAEVTKLLELIQNEKFDGNYEKDGITLVGFLIHAYNHITLNDDVLPQLEKCITSLLDKPKINVDMESDEGISIIDVSHKRDIFGKVFKRSAVYELLKTKINSVDDDDVKQALIARLDDEETLVLKDILDIILSEPIKSIYYDSDNVDFKDSIESGLKVFLPSSTSLSSGDLAMFFEYFAPLQDDAKISLCNNMLKMLVGKIDDVGYRDIALPYVDNNEGASNISSVSQESNSEKLVGFFEDFLKDRNIQKENELGALIWVKLVRTYQSQVNHSQ